MLRSAIRRGFDVPAAVKDRLVDRMDQIVQGESDRLSVAAAKVLVAADAVDVRATNGPTAHQHIHVQGEVEKPKSLEELKQRLLERRIARRNLESLVDSGGGI